MTSRRGHLPRCHAAGAGPGHTSPFTHRLCLAVEGDREVVSRPPSLLARSALQWTCALPPTLCSLKMVLDSNRDLKGAWREGRLANPSFPQG